MDSNGLQVTEVDLIHCSSVLRARSHPREIHTLLRSAVVFSVIQKEIKEAQEAFWEVAV